jgi:hypothetical protein
MLQVCMRWRWLLPGKMAGAAQKTAQQQQQQQKLSTR